MRIKSRPAVAIVMLVLLGGCVRLRKDYPERDLYHLNVEREEVLPSPDGGPVIGVRMFRAGPALSGREFVYRVGESRYATDFYNTFFVSPAEQVRSIASDWLQSSGLVRVVLDRASGLRPDYMWEGRLADLHGDFRDRDDPRAVIRLEFVILDIRPLEPVIIFSRSYAQSVSIKERTPAALVRGWEKGLFKILSDFEREIKIKAVEF